MTCRCRRPGWCRTPSASPPWPCWWSSPDCPLRQTPRRNVSQGRPAHSADAGSMWAMPYAYLGPEGTFSEAALRAVDPDAEPLSCPTIQAALASVREGTAQRAVVPIESSVEGVVTATLDDLATGNDLVIVAELQVPIAFALLARPGTALRDIKKVGGHPQSMPQCRGWLAGHLPDCEWVPLASNAEAARQAADSQVDAALAGAFAADRYGLEVLVPDVHDRANAVTRFVVVSPPRPLPARTGADRTSLAAFLAEDHPGALLEILTEFAVRGINLTTIQSRPTGDRLGQYYFFIDCEGHVDDARVGEALMGLRRVCQEVRFLGSYARCDGATTQVPPRTLDEGRSPPGHGVPPGRLEPGLPDAAGSVRRKWSFTGTVPSPDAAAAPARGASSPAEARGASARAGPGRPSAGRTAWSGCRGTGPPASPPAAPGRSAARPRWVSRPARTAATAAQARRRVRARARPRVP